MKIQTRETRTQRIKRMNKEANHGANRHARRVKVNLPAIQTKGAFGTRG